jgi:hypothetical protein
MYKIRNSGIATYVVKFVQVEIGYVVPTRGQLISKAIYGLLTSPKKRMDEFDLFAFLLFTANKSNSSVRFLGESRIYDLPICFLVLSDL